MTLFSHENRQKTPETRRIFAAFEIAHTLVDFTAAICFLIGSILFFWKAYETPAIWLFVIGSFFFAMKPTLKLIRELKLAAMGDAEDLADRYEP
ncbi:YrhK family protein [Primorskyibacter sp. 2E107]|uniref:YrhK family protein n=1 Tax=Primorskyibacter sp. 2E107 TaxID=3403458 RepID=UPI003AF5A168